MPPRTSRARRGDALTRERIVATAIGLLDDDGDAGLTFKALTARLATGPGAIYWHVANRSELLGAATDAVIGAALTDEPTSGPKASGSKELPHADIRALSLRLFDAILEHPWVASPLSESSWQVSQSSILETVGRRVGALGVPEERWFVAASVLVQYILGAASQNAAYARVLPPQVSREEFLDAVATTWARLDPGDYPFTRAVADQMRHHDDREQFLAGIDFILAGIVAQQAPPTG